MRGCGASAILLTEIALVFLALFPLVAILGTPFGWGLWALILLVAFALGTTRAIHENMLLALIIAFYGFGMTLAFQISFTGWTAGVATVPLYAALSAFSLFAVFLRFGRADEKTRQVSRLLLAFTLAACLIALFSGALGGAGRMYGFFTQVLGFDEDAARQAVTVVRKGVHFICYGTIAVLLYRAARVSGTSISRALIFGFGIAVAHGVFDEMRQTMHSERTGTPADIFLDAAGALVFLAVAAALDQRGDEAT